MSGVTLRGGRVIDPASGFDGVADVVMRDGRVVDVGPGLDAVDTEVVDVAGYVVAPGFVDLHSHAMNLAGQRLQACDGVTTALELEAGAWPVSSAYDWLERDGATINFGFSASWALARMHVLAQLDISGPLAGFLRNVSNPAWQRDATAAELSTLIDALEAAIAEGALGIGLLLGYAPRIAPDEYVAVAALAARHGVPTFTHARELVEVSSDVPIDGAEEIVRAATETGAHMHYCHVNSTSLRHVDRVLDLVAGVRREGARVTTEAYPYGAGSTGIGAFFLDPDRLPRLGLEPSRIRYMPTGEQVADMRRLQELRDTDPGGLAIVEFFNENDPRERQLLHRSLLFDDACVASDAMPLTWMNNSPAEDAWPVPPNAITHPRTAGTFARSLRVLIREHGMPLLDAVRRLTLLPATVVEEAAPAMRRKGRLSAGSDADVTVFDPQSVTDQATYEDSTRPSTGIAHVLVNGEFVVRHGQLVRDARPGRAVKSER